MKKLDIIISKLRNSIGSNNYLSSEDDVALLREYRDCFYCQSYRKDMSTKDTGVCANCPVHRIGEELIGRKLLSNGCYRVSTYREMVRLSWWYKEEPSYASATALINAIQATKKHMEEYKDRLNIVIYKDL